LNIKKLLQERAKASLQNPDEVTAAALNTAVRETEGEISGRLVKEWAVMDFAYIRLKIYLKIELLESDIALYKEACKEISNSPYEDGDIRYAQALVRAKKSDWE
jgi:hypothetical protein